MKNLLAIIALLGAGLLAFAASSAKRASQPDTALMAVPDMLDRAESITRSHLDDGTLHGAVALVRSGSDPRALYSGALSYPDGTQIDGSTRFRIASLTKVITRIAILRLAEQHRLSLDDSLAEQRRGFHADWAEETTIRQLLSFRSGLPRERSGASNPIDAGVTLDEHGRALPFLDSLVDDGPTIEPGSRVLYSNLGYFHLGGVIEAVTGHPIEEALSRLVFVPAGMTRTSLGDSKLGDLDNLAVGHRSTDDGAPEEVPPFPIEPRYTAGGLVSTLDDLVSLSKALLHGDLLGEESRALLMSEFGDSQNQTLRVAGLVPGFANVWSISIEPPAAVILLNNVVGSNPNAVVDAHDEIASVLRGSGSTDNVRDAARAEDGWKPLVVESDWPEHALMKNAAAFLAESMRSDADADAVYEASLVVRGKTDAVLDEDSREAYRWMASYQVALRDRYGPFELAWWRPGEHGAFEFLFEGPDGRALRIKLRPSDTDPAVSSTLSIATMGFDADSSLYEGFSDE